MRRPRARTVALGALGLLVLVIFGWIPFWLGGAATARRFTFRDRENEGLTPASFQLPFEAVAFRSADGVDLKGWWVPAPGARGTVVLVHGLNRSRIEMVKKVPFLHRLGWNALLFDLRHHGDSGAAVRSFGYFERQDVHAAVAEARRRLSGLPVAVWGVSLGAASATLAAAEDPTIAAIVCDSTYRSLRDTVGHHLKLFRSFRWWFRILPEWPVANEVVFWIGRRGGFDPDVVDVKKAAAKLNGRPVLFVANSGDRRMPVEIAFELKEAAGPRAQVLVVPGVTHGGAYREGTAAYERAVEDVLTQAVGGPPAQVASR
ncbi:MAG TPA: alpha/beta fold hydrolase [Vicinamibacteria bacterium]|nr:alpha/beta fold hydrolase [Vicinamibacteria bacterium]